MNNVKRILLIASFFLMAAPLCWAQTNKFPNTGNAGIGTTTPIVPLEIKKTAEDGVESLLKLSVSDAPGDFLTIDNATGVDNQFIPLIRGKKVTDNRYALMISGSIGDGQKDNGDRAVVAFDARLDTGKVKHRPLFVWQSYATSYMTMLSDGSVGIGTTNPQAKLAVDGNILATEVKVKTNITVPDYVFEPAYELPTLTEIEAFVKEHKHLPEIPSAADIQRNGLDLAEMNLLLLKKVEELTLLLIDTRKVVDSKGCEIAQLSSRLSKLEEKDSLNSEYLVNNPMILNANRTKNHLNEENNLP